MTQRSSKTQQPIFLVTIKETFFKKRKEYSGRFSLTISWMIMQLQYITVTLLINKRLFGATPEMFKDTQKQ